MKRVRDAFVQGFFNFFLIKTLIVLILKEDHPVKMKEFRPISLCNVLYKLINKVLVNRIQQSKPLLIRPMQSGFVSSSGAQHNTYNTLLIMLRCLSRDTQLEVATAFLFAYSSKYF